jgi:hypothetical protein
MEQKAIERRRGGRFRLRLSSAERELLRELPAELRSLLDSDSEDPSLQRLFPPAYDGDAAAQQEYRELMHGELLGQHRDALRVLEQTADREELSAEEVHAWLAALNDLRLVLGTRLDVTEDLYETQLDLENPEAAELGVYLYLTWLQEQFVEAAGSAPLA